MNIEIMKEFFGWITLINLVLFIWVAVMCMFCRGFIYNVHGKLFDLKEDTINAMLYGFLGVYKIVFLAFNFIPWIALVIMSK